MHRCRPAYLNLSNAHWLSVSVPDTALEGQDRYCTLQGTVSPTENKEKSISPPFASISGCENDDTYLFKCASLE